MLFKAKESYPAQIQTKTKPKLECHPIIQNTNAII
jgi:hypothetical protein